MTSTATMSLGERLFTVNFGADFKCLLFQPDEWPGRYLKSKLILTSSCLKAGDRQCIGKAQCEGARGSRGSHLDVG